ncbi:6-phosphogluconolactonase [Mesorhizobium retamae]|uniref:6-phosphogluconolactonase n=1 Tax=Mesorhizobium retamae TaxID=2912854 RepID=A0ABS9QD73_9HYPH|nr:6-phosphogluconolactonase [Mesorhizobium sp. IRAMC:0171]MCG7505350.1 6-phosphogluconolactonase [Mesorhizobium sp. IRAMC:0171]
MKVRIHETPSDVGMHLARRILAGIKTANETGRAYVLGCPSGRSPMPIYEGLASLLAENAIDCSRLIIVMMDEYLVETSAGTLQPPPASAHFSCRGFGERHIVGCLNAVLPEAWRVRLENLWLPDHTAPDTYDGRIAAAGGIDFFILASGAGDGHIAFNPPGTSRQATSRIVEMGEQTRRDNLATFPEFTSLEEVPRHGITVGVASIVQLSAAAGMIVWGSGKQATCRRLAEATTYDPAWPATIVAECRGGELHADRSAAEGLQ